MRGIRIYRVAIAVAVVATIAPTVASSKKPAPAAAQDKGAYRPGLGEIMLLTQTRHMKLWLAGAAQNWDLADYQIDELKEGLEDAGKLVPTYKGMPVGAMIDSVMTSPISDMETAIRARDVSAFKTSFATLTNACNACHQSANKAFIVIQKPGGDAFPNQVFTPKP